VTQRVADRRQAGEDLQQIGLLRGAVAEVGVDRGGDFGAMRQQQALQRTQARRAGGPVGLRVARVGLTQPLQRVGQAVGGVGGHAVPHAIPAT